MRTMTAAMAAHIQLEVTTLCRCWYFVRMDGQTFRYTEHDADLTIDGQVYKSYASGSVSAVEFKITLAANNGEINGFMDSNEVSERDLVGGRFRNASFYNFIANWADTSPTMGIIRGTRGFVGEVRRSGAGYTMEFMSLSQRLQMPIGSYTSGSCRSPLGGRGTGSADGCFYPVEPDVWQANHDYLRTTIAGGSGADIDPRPNGHNLWDGGGPTKNAVIHDGGDNYVNPVLTADFILDGDPVTITAEWVTVKTGKITNFWFTPTREGHKPAIGTVSITVTDVIQSEEHVDVVPTVENGFQYSATGSSGTSGGSEPTFPTAVDATVVDGGVTWTAKRAAKRSASVSAVTSRKIFQVNDILGDLTDGTGGSLTGGYFVLGSVTFTNGDNEDISIDIEEFTGTGPWTIKLFKAAPFDIAISDTLVLKVGCDHSPGVCKANFGNFVNFRGEEDIPGMDKLFTVSASDGTQK